MRADDPRAVVCELVQVVKPYDEKESQDQADILAWIASDEPVFRKLPPATPPKHLVVYFALLDEADRCLLLVDHVKARLWLLPGGHVDEGEDPRRSVEREAAEELGISATFHDRFGGGDPFFLTVTQTRGEHVHTDVTLWFVLQADRDAGLLPDDREFRQVRWFSLDDTAEWPADVFDPQMHRFVQKLTSALDGPVSS